MHQSVEQIPKPLLPIKVYAIVDKKLALWEVDSNLTYNEAIELVKKEVPINTTLLALIK